jgi:iron(III) transport system ATP-binding protein
VSALHVSGISKAFGSVPVLDQVSLDVADGSLVSILGPSGCGKTTLLRLVAGFLHPDAGTIAFSDRTVVGDGVWTAPHHRRVGYVAQEGALFPHLDVARNIAFGLPRAQRRGRARVRELLELVGLDAALLERYPHELSGGQQQRVALARALAPRPSLVLLDEPFAALDAQLRLQTGTAVVHALRAAEATAVLVTHDQSEALSLTDAVAVMRGGRIVQVGAPAEVYGAPADLGVARFVGDAIVLPAEIAGGLAHCVLGALHTDGAVAAGPAEVLVRPEQLVLGEDGVPGEVEEIAFFGHDAIVQLRLGAERRRVAAHVLGSAVPSPGQGVRVSVEGPVRAYAIAAGADGAPPPAGLLSGAGPAPVRP